VILSITGSELKWKLLNFALLCDTFAFFAVHILLTVNLKAGKSKTAKDAKVSQRSRKEFGDDA